MIDLADLHVVARDGEGPGAARVVVVHGAMDRGASFGRVARHLPEAEVVRYDRRGYGHAAHLEPGTMEDHVGDLLAVVGERPSVLFGHSVGGVVALAAATRRPDLVRALLVFEAPAPWSPWWPVPRPRPADESAADEAEAFMVRAIGERFWSRLPARTRAARRAEGEALRADIASLRDRAPFAAPEVGAPVVSASGSDTTWWHQRAAEELATAVPLGVHAVVPGATHGAHLTHPAAVADLVRWAVDLAGLGAVDGR